MLARMLIVVSILAAPALAQQPYQPPQTPVPPFPYEEAEVKVVSDVTGEEVTLAGALVIPGELDEGFESLANDDGRHPCVVLLTGSGSQDRNSKIALHKPFAVIADHLARRGIASLRLDDRGMGESEGQLALMTLEDLAKEALVRASFCAAHESIDPARIAIVGHSQGAVVGAMACAIDSEESSGIVDLCVMLAGFGCNGVELLREQNRALMEAGGMEAERIEKLVALHDAFLATLESGAPQVDVREALLNLARAQLLASREGGEIPEAQAKAVERVAERQSAAMVTPLMQSLASEEPAEWLGRVDQPVLALFAEFDLQVVAAPNAERIGAALEEGGNEDVTLVTLRGLNHLFQPTSTGLPSEYGIQPETFAPSALDTLSAWLIERFSDI